MTAIGSPSPSACRFISTIRDDPHGQLPGDCEIASNFGSDSLLVQGLGMVDEPGFEKIEFGAAIHLPFDEFELGDLAFGLTV